MTEEFKRAIPAWVKQVVYKRDKGRCVLCGAQDQLHFDHDLPFAKGGSGLTPANVRVLCARHNLRKGAKIELPAASWRKAPPKKSPTWSIASLDAIFVLS